MSEWQPARILKRAHGGVTTEERRHLMLGPVRIAKVDVIDLECDGPFFVVHPEDLERVGVHDEQKYVCEHEILTD